MKYVRPLVLVLALLVFATMVTNRAHMGGAGIIEAASVNSPPEADDDTYTATDSYLRSDRCWQMITIPMVIRCTLFS